MSHHNRRNNQPSKQSLVDIVITTAGRFDCLEKCLDAVYREAQDIPLSIYVVDNESVLEERKNNETLFQYHPENDPNKNIIRFEAFRFAKNVGFPRAANQGAKSGHSPIILFVSDDVEIQEGSLQEILNTFKDESVGIVGCRLLFPPNSRSGPAGKIQHVGISLNIRGEPVHPLIGWSPTHPKTQMSRDVWATTGACFGIRRQLFNKAGGFDPIFGKGTWEDTDLCMKVRQMGKRVYLNSKAWAYHYTGATVEKRKEGFPLQQNMMIFQSRWQNSGMLVWDEWSYL